MEKKSGFVDLGFVKKCDELVIEYEFLLKENADKKQSRSEHTTQLHETQRHSITFDEFFVHV
jgi:hypothetical protein